MRTRKRIGIRMGGFMSYFRNLFGSKEMRILILGLDGAGKTTLLYRLQVIFARGYRLPYFLHFWKLNRNIIPWHLVSSLLCSHSRVPWVAPSVIIVVFDCCNIPRSDFIDLFRERKTNLT